MKQSQDAVCVTTHLANHHAGRNSLNRLGHLASSKAFKESSSTLWESFCDLAFSSAGFWAKWTSGLLLDANLVVIEYKVSMMAINRKLMSDPIAFGTTTRIPRGCLSKASARPTRPSNLEPIPGRSKLRSPTFEKKLYSVCSQWKSGNG